MTQNEIIEMARQAGAVYSNDHAVSLLDDEIIIFAQLVAQHEREACAKVCEEYADDSRTGVTCAEVIRARKES
jgi:hypothetical protein